ncbi:MAG TPA: glycosyltransferase [Ruminococcaceae bacterium]|nr:glycosyltransferase [Oscillospiraceae bacterium]
MKVSIITSCFNRVSTIEGAIKSVLKQDYPEIEYIIVDGASKDGTLDVIKKYNELTHNSHFVKTNPRFSFRYISEPDHGMYEGINKGLRMATGNVIGLVHSDDFLYSEHTIRDLVDEFKRTGADFVYGDGLYVNSLNTQKIIRNWIGGDYRLWKVKHGWLPLHPTCYIKRSVMEKRGFYNETYKIAADSDLLFRYLLVGDLSVAYLHEYIVRMRMGGLSTDNAKRKQMWKEDIRMYRSHGLNPVITKIEKMMWKIPQFIRK